MKVRIILLVIASYLSLNGSGAHALNNDYQTPIRELLNSTLRKAIHNPTVLEAIRAQNRDLLMIENDEIYRLDQQWRQETQTQKRPLINGVLQRPVSIYLKNLRKQSKGLYTEIFVMDAHGLNVGQSDMTSDYWQGDEEKWLKTFLAGKGAVHLGGVELDESSQTFQVQVSIPVIDPDADEVIGAATIGINLDLLLP